MAGSALQVPSVTDTVWPTIEVPERTGGERLIGDWTA
jgi:hypothetical protein